jgi:hypothetical protein
MPARSFNVGRKVWRGQDSERVRNLSGGSVWNEKLYRQLSRRLAACLAVTVAMLSGENPFRKSACWLACGIHAVPFTFAETIRGKD